MLLDLCFYYFYFYGNQTTSCMGSHQITFHSHSDTILSIINLFLLCFSTSTYFTGFYLLKCDLCQDCRIFNTKVTQQVFFMEQDQLSAVPVFLSRINVAQCLILCVMWTIVCHFVFYFWPFGLSVILPILFNSYVVFTNLSIIRLFVVPGLTPPNTHLPL